MKRVLNVGGGNKGIALPPQYAGFEQFLLDIDPKGMPDIVCDARRLTTIEGGRFDAVYCAHNLEHYYRHDVPKVLAGFMHVLNDRGFAHICVPDIAEVIRLSLERGLDIEDTLYESPAGPITALDVLYGHAVEIEKSENDYFAHKTGFSRKSLTAILYRSGFAAVYSKVGDLEITAVAFKSVPDAEIKALLGLVDG